MRPCWRSFPGALDLYGLAADRDQGRLLLDSIAGYTERTPELSGAIDVGAYRVTANRSGSTLDVLAADAPGAWGLRPAFVVVDEIAQWGSTGAPRRLWEAVSSAAAKTNGRLVVLTTAGDPAHWSKAVLDHAHEDPLWRVHELRGPAPWLDPERLAEQRRRLPDSSYRRLFLNEWTAPEDRLTAADDLDACMVLDGPLPPEAGERYVIGLDVGVTNDRTAAVVAHAEKTQREGQIAGVRVVVDRVQVWAGTRRTRCSSPK